MTDYSLCVRCGKTKHIANMRIYEHFRVVEGEAKYVYGKDAFAPDVYHEGMCWDCSIKTGIPEPQFKCNICYETVGLKQRNRHLKKHSFLRTKQYWIHFHLQGDNEK